MAEADRSRLNRRQRIVDRALTRSTFSHIAPCCAACRVVRKYRDGKWVWVRVHADLGVPALGAP
jgi:hypothetical protein